MCNDEYMEASMRPLKVGRALPDSEKMIAGATGVPVPCLIRYVLVKYAASNADALMGRPSLSLVTCQGFRHLPATDLRAVLV
jgi:hypothetical protein